MRMKSKSVNISYVPYALDIMQLLCMRLQIGISNFIWHCTKVVQQPLGGDGSTPPESQYDAVFGNSRDFMDVDLPDVFVNPHTFAGEGLGSYYDC